MAKIQDGILVASNGAGISIEGLLKKAEVRSAPAFCEPPSDRELIYLLKEALQCLWTADRK